MYKAIKIKDNVYWVGALDYTMKQFHGYNTQRGTTYNAYLILDEKITLVDTVKAPFTQEMIERISSVIDPSKIDVLISNHVEMDHSGALPEIMKLCPNATIVTVGPSGVNGLKAHYGDHYKFHAIKSNDSYSIGKRTFHFVTTPLLHWPDNMVTYESYDKILYSNDGFGQHLCTNSRYCDELEEDVVYFEAKKYYANILMCYGSEAKKAINIVNTLDIKMILPSHGVIYRKARHIKKIIDLYTKWSDVPTTDEALIAYDSMWHSTEKMANAINEVLTNMGIKTHVYDLKSTHPSDIISDVLDCKYIFVGSPTLNGQMMPTVAGFLTYLKGLSPRNRMALGFSSYGWNNKAIPNICKDLTECGFTLFEEQGVSFQYIPTDLQLLKLQEKIKTYFAYKKPICINVPEPEDIEE